MAGLQSQFQNLNIKRDFSKDVYTILNRIYQRRRHGHNHEQVKLTTSLYHTLTDTSYHIITFLTDDKTLWILLHFQD